MSGRLSDVCVKTQVFEFSHVGRGESGSFLIVLVEFVKLREVQHDVIAEQRFFFLPDRFTWFGPPVHT